MIQFQNITRTEYSDIAKINTNVEIPKQKFGMEYQKVIINGNIVGIRCYRESAVLVRGEQFIIVKEFKGKGRYIIKKVIREMLNNHSVYVSIWTKEVFDIMKGAFVLEAKKFGKHYKVTISASKNIINSEQNSNPLPNLDRGIII